MTFRDRLVLRAMLVPLLLCGLARHAFAEDTLWRNLADRVFELVTHDADLPNALIPITMAEDRRGFLWFGGDAGLVRWDGYQFREFRPDSAKPDGLRNADVWTLHKDTHGVLWIGTTSSGLGYYDEAQDRLICLPLAGLKCGMQHVWSIDEDGAGGLWIATNAGLFRLGPDRKVAGHWQYITGQDDSQPENEVLALLRDRQGVLWIGTSKGLVRSISPDSGFLRVQLPGASSPAVSRLVEDSKGQIWAATRHAGTYVIDRNGMQARIVPATAPSAVAGIATEPSAVLEVSAGRVWIGTYGQGILDVDAVTLLSRTIEHDPFLSDGLEDNSVQSLYRDASGIIWVATDTGLSKYDPGVRGLMTFSGNVERRNGLPGLSVMAVYAAANGKVWAGFQGNGFVVIDPVRARVTGLPGSSVYAISEAPNGGVLLATDRGLFLTDPDGLRVTRLTVPGLSPTAEIHTLKTLDGVVWLSPREGGLWAVRIAANGTVSLQGNGRISGLTNPQVNAIAAAPDGRLAVGTDSGLNLLDTRSLAIEHIWPDPSNPRGLDTGLISSFVTDQQHRLWVGTFTGLDLLEGLDSGGHPIFRRFGVADGLPNASVDGLQVDRQGNIWASTDVGLAVIDPNTSRVSALRHADGLAITNYYDGSSAALSTGEIVFGGIGGITMVLPQEIASWHYQPPVVFTEIRVGGQAVPVTPSVLITAKSNSLEVEFSSLDFSAPARNRYRYRLEGVDNQWIDTDAAHRAATYTNLPPGSYVFRLLGSNRNGIWTQPDTTLAVKVLPAWFQTLWFRLLSIALGTLLLTLVLRASTAILRRRQRILEHQVAERTRELSASQIELRRANIDLEKRVVERTQSLASSEARFRAWFEHAEDAVFVIRVEPTGRFVIETVNSAVERLYGVTAAACSGHEPSEIFPAQAVERVLARLRAASKGEPIQFQSSFTLRDGERLLDSWIVPVRDPQSGRVERLVGASRDITERRALEARSAQAQKLQALGGLAGGIAHDFNNILQAVGGAARLLEQRPDDQDNVKRFARNTIAATDRGASITKRLLAFARSDDLHVEAVGTFEVLQNMTEVLAFTLGDGVKIRTSLAPTLPFVMADRKQLETAIVNLGTNARDAMRGEGVLTLSAEAVQVEDGMTNQVDLPAGAYVRIEVADTGAGMDAATLQRSVEPFFTTKPQGIGTGLGLGLVKGFVEQAGGGMLISSNIGQGTIVQLWLRQAGVIEMHTPNQPVSPTQTEPASAQILVVDDDDLVLDAVSGVLESVGFAVVVAKRGLEALALITKGARPDALVCDFSMPGMNGKETIRCAREMLPDLPCFLLTGFAEEQSLLDAKESFTLLLKPIAPETLIFQINSKIKSKDK